MTDAVVSALSELPGGMFAWSYPAAVMSIPGLLVIIAVLAQAGGALAWLPIAQRNFGGFGFRRRKRERDSAATRVRLGT